VRHKAGRRNLEEEKTTSMKAPVQKVFIVAENALVVNGLRHLLQERYSGLIQVTCFFDFKSCLRNVKEGCNILITDPLLDGKRGPEVVLSVKLISPRTKVLIYCSTEDVLADMDSILQERYLHLGSRDDENSSNLGGRAM
jgi:hypothetical protein